MWFAHSLFAVLLLITLATAQQTGTITIFANNTQPFSHFYDTCVGSGHATLTLRADWRKQLTETQSDLAVQYVRYHGTLDEDMVHYDDDVYIGNPFPMSYYNVYDTLDFLLSINMKPIVELSFTPDPLASGNATCFYYKGQCSPPSNLTLYESLVQAFVQALDDRYGAEEVSTWLFEVYNEPDLQYQFTQQDYFLMYQQAARAVKSVNPNFRVGGPATSQTHWIPEFKEFCLSNNVPFDFISTHSYPNDPPNGRPDDVQFQYERVYNASQQAGDTPLYFTEWSSSFELGDPSHDMTEVAAFVISSIASVRHLNLQAYSYWTFSDVFEEEGIPRQNVAFYGGFGMITLYNVKKPVYRAFELLHKLGNDEAEVVLSPNLNTTLTVLAVAKDSHEFHVLLANFLCPLCGTTENITVDITINELGFVPKTASVSLIDTNHTNPRAEWINQGSPNYPSPSQVNALQAASKLYEESIPFTYDKGVVSFNNVYVTAYGVVGITLSDK